MTRGGRNGGRGRGGGFEGRTQNNAGTEPRSHKMEKMPNALEAKIGVDGYDAEGVKQITQMADGSYNLPETWRTLSLWCGENGCELVKAMFQAEDAVYPRFDDQEEVDMELYENNMFYRNGYDMVRKSNLDQSRRLLTQEVKCFTKLWSLVDDKLKTNAMSDEDFDFVMRSQRPDVLRTLLVERVTAGVADNAEDVIELLREEYVNTSMTTFNASLASYVERWQDLSSRLNNAGLAYTEREMANRFVKGLSKRFSQLQANIMVEAPAVRPQTIHAAFVRAQKWEDAQKEVFGSVGKGPSGREWSAYATECGTEKPKGGRGNGKKPWKKSSDDKESKVDAKEPKTGKKSGDRWTEDGQPICDLCKGIGHYRYECPSKGRLNAAVLCCHVEKRSMILLDDGAEISLFKDDFLVSNMVTCDSTTTINGAVGDTNNVTDKKGYFGDIQVYLSSSANINLLSLEEVRENHQTFELEGWGTRVINQSTGEAMDFLLRGGKTKWLDPKDPVQMTDVEFVRRWNAQQKRKQVALEKTVLTSGRSYAAAVTRTPERVHTVAVTTVAENKKLFSKREIEQAEKAKEFVKNSGHRNLQNLAESMDRMVDVSITRTDLKNQKVIWGPHRAALKGKAKDTAAPVVSKEPPPKLIRREATIHLDPFEIANSHAIACMVTPMSLGMVQPVSALRQSTLHDGVMNLINTLSAMNIDVIQMVYDPDKALSAACRQVVGEIVHTEVGAGEHVPEAENFIQKLKETCRTKIHDLPWKLPPSLIPDLTKFACRRRNCFITRATGQIPLEDTSGRKVSFAKEFECDFGDICEVYVKPQKTNTMTERTVTAIALYPVGRSGAWRFMNAKTWKRMTRRRKFKVPTDDDAIMMMNARYELEADKNRGTVEKLQDFGAEHVKADPGPDMPVNPAVIQPNVNFGEDVVEDDEDDTDCTSKNSDVILEEETINDSNAIISEQHGDHLNANKNHDSIYSDEGVIDTNITQPTSHRPRSKSKESNDIVEVAYISKVEDRTYVAVVQMDKKAKKMTVSKAMKEMKESTLEASIKELRQIDEKGSWTPKKLKELSGREIKRIVRTFMFITKKYSPEGQFEKLKARLVAMGNQQDASDVGMPTSAPTVNTTAVFIMAALAAKENRHVMTCDIGGAFLHANIPDDIKVHVELDKIMAAMLCQIRPEYRTHLTEKGTLVLQLNRALYGLLQAARLWYNKLSAVLASKGYTVNPVDPCCWNKGTGSEQSTVLFHVDDLKCMSKRLKSLKELEEEFIVAFGIENVKCKYGDIHEYLGMLFEYDRKTGTVTVSMLGSIVSILTRTQTSATATTPAHGRLFDVDEKAEKLDVKKAKEFHSLVQEISYISQRVRWDLMLAIGFLKTRVSAPDVDDWKKLLRILAYLNGTKDLKLTLGADTPIGIDSYIDSSHAVYSNGRSQSGLGITMGRGLVMGKSSKQNINTKSSTESELVGTSDMASNVIWCREFMLGQGYNVGPATIRQDNQSTIHLIKQGRASNTRTKHINVRYFFVHDRIEKGDVNLIYTPTEDMVADFFTKPLNGSLFAKLRGKLLGQLES